MSIKGNRLTKLGHDGERTQEFLLVFAGFSGKPVARGVIGPWETRRTISLKVRFVDQFWTHLVGRQAMTFAIMIAHPAAPVRNMHIWHMCKGPLCIKNRAVVGRAHDPA